MHSRSPSIENKSKSKTRKTLHPGTPRPRSRPDDFRPRPTKRANSLPSNAKPSSPPESQRYRRRGGEPKDLSKEKLQETENRRSKSNAPNSTVESESLPDFLLWVKNEPIDFGIVSPYPCPKIGINILRKIAEYCRDKPGHYPELSLSQWCHICKYKLQWNNQDLCATYFRVFDILTRPCGDWARGGAKKEKNEKDVLALGEGESLDEIFYRAVKQGTMQDNEIKDNFKVQTLQFLLFLYIQHFRRLHKKFMIRPSTFKQDESWPKIWRHEFNSINLSLGRGSSGSSSGNTGPPNIPEIQHAEFLSAGLEEIIEFLTILNNRAAQNRDKGEGDQISDLSLELDQDSLSIDIMKSLSFLIGAASTSLDKEFKSLDACLTLPEVAGQLEYSRIGKTVSKRCLIEWILRHLKINPWGPSCIPIPQVPLSVMTGLFDRDGESAKKNRIFWNTQSFPKAWFLISGIEKQVLHLDSLEPMSSIKIHRCIDAHIYLPGTHQTVLINKCHGATITLGVVTKIVKVSDCSGIILSAVGRLFVIYDVVSCILHLLTPSSPIICGNKNRDIRIAPFNTTYSSLGAHMRMAGIIYSFQQWNRPLEMASDGYPLDDRKGHQSNVALLSPEKFMTVLFPFRTVAPIHSQPPLSSQLVSIPYQRRLETAAERVELAMSEFKEKMLASDEDTNLIYQITLYRFKKWLKETGNFDLVVGLCSLHKSLQQRSSSPLVCSKGHDLSCIPKSVKNFFCAAAGLNLFSEKAKRNQGKQLLAHSTSENKYFGGSRRRTSSHNFPVPPNTGVNANA